MPSSVSHQSQLGMASHNMVNHPVRHAAHPREMAGAHMGHVVAQEHGLSNHMPNTGAHVQTTNLAGDQWGTHSILDSDIRGQVPVTPPAQHFLDIRTNPHLQMAADQKMSAMEAAWTETMNKRKKVGRFNTDGPPDPNPLTRWPNENIPYGSEGFRPSYDKMSQTEFVLGFVVNIIEAPTHHHKDAMLEELREILETATNAGWIAAKSAFEKTMTRIAAGRLKWDDSTAMLHSRFRANQQVLMGQNRGQYHQQGERQTRGNFKNPSRRAKYQGIHKRYPCWNYNDGYCWVDTKDHTDPSTNTTYLHVCEICYKYDAQEKTHAAINCPFRQAQR